MLLEKSCCPKWRRKHLTRYVYLCYKGHDHHHTSIHKLTDLSSSTPSELSMHRKTNITLESRHWTASSQYSIPRNHLAQSPTSQTHERHPYHTPMPPHQSPSQSLDRPSSSSQAQPPAQARRNSSTTSPLPHCSQNSTTTPPSQAPKPPYSSST